MQIKNGNIFTRVGFFEPHDIITSGTRIKQISKSGISTSEQVVDATDCYVIPGLVDIHIHGAFGSDFCDATGNSIENISNYLASVGVTSFLGTTMSLDEENLTKIVSAAVPYYNKDSNGAVIRGVNMEGPFLSQAKKGAQSGKNLISPDIDMFNRLYSASAENIRIVDLAPELNSAMDFIKSASEKCTVSLAHTSANFDTSMKAFAAGASHITHLFNAMTPLSHRDPGVIGAGIEAAKYVELIADGIHIHPTMVRAAYKLFGNRICLVSDAISALGMPDGSYSLGGQDVTVTKNTATLNDSTIAGSVTSLFDCMKTAVSFGIPLELAVRSATENPAKAAQIFNEVGSIEEGKRADFIVLDSSLNIKYVIIGGSIFNNKN